MMEKITLDNGLRIVTERIPYVRSASVGIWVGTGSRYETAAENGASHFIEHMLFKGTETRSASELASLTDMLGGHMNAYTTKETTCFYTQALDSHLPLALDLLCDMFFCSKFDEGDVESERRVIVEEMNMYDDTPEDLVMERLSAVIYKGGSLARPILGRERTLDGFTGEFLRNYKDTHYSPERIVVALCGSFADSDVEYIRERFSAIPARAANSFKPAKYIPAYTVKRRAIEQNNLVLAFPCNGLGSPDRYKLQVLNNILGAASSSRLFQKVREENGLCYSVYSFTSVFSDTGIFGIYTATGRDTERKALELICGELRRICDEGVDETELYRTREQMKANLLMGLESTGARMNGMGRNTLQFDRVPEYEEIIAGYDAVTAEDVRMEAQSLLRPKLLSLSAVGRVCAADEYREMINGFLSF